MSEWIEWGGGECPVPPDTVVLYRMRDGEEDECRAGKLRWHFVSDIGDIIAYKVVAPAETSDGWIEWNGGECPVPPGAMVKHRLRSGDTCVRPAIAIDWHRNDDMYDVVAYRIFTPGEKSRSEALHGGKLSGDHYYRVQVAEPISPELAPYSAECADIIEALGMTFNEGEAFKAIWRLAARRQGRGKVGGSAQYDADKVAHYGARVAAQTRREGK